LNWLPVFDGRVTMPQRARSVSRLSNQIDRTKGENINEIAILIAILFALLVGFLSIQGVRAIIYSHSGQWKLQQRLRRFVQREAE